MEFVCRVGTATGEIVERSFEAPDEQALRAEVERQGLYLFSTRRPLGAGGLRLRRPRVTTAALLLFAQELAALLKAGLPLFQSLDVALERQEEPVFRRSLTAVRDRVKSGWSLSDAFRAEGELYPTIFSANLVAGERSGSIETVLRRFVQYLRLTQALRRKVVAAAVYPTILLVLMSAIISVMLLFVIPEFQSFYEDLGAELPLPTRLLIALAQLLRGNLVALVLALVFAVVLVRLWLRRPGSGVVLDRLLLRLPYLGAMLGMYATSQLSRTLATLVSGGLPLLNALEVAAASVGNRAMAAGVSAAAPQVREGRSLTVALESTGLLEPVALEMIRVGEQTGALAEMLTAIADFYDEELDTRLQIALSLVEPLMLVAMALVVAAMLLAFYLPLFESVSAVGQSGR
jgi:type IV pilus assembly protein PilC